MTTELIAKPTIAPEHYALVREQFARGCSDSEFRVFLELANRYQLDPFARQIWAVKEYGNAPARIIVARDGYLAVAHRSGQFDGMSDPEYDTDEKGNVTHVRIHVYRKDMSHPFAGDAWDNEDNLRQSVWTRRPRTMLLKVAESRALRKAFSVSGTYCPEEMGYEETAPERIVPAESDIAAGPVTVEEPAKTNPEEPVRAPEKNACNVITEKQFTEVIKPTYERQRLNTDVFAKAGLGGGLYDKDMIDADYRAQIFSRRNSDPVSCKPLITVSGEVCEVCGAKLLAPEVPTSRQFCDGHLFCEKHQMEYRKRKRATRA